MEYLFRIWISSIRRSETSFLIDYLYCMHQYIHQLLNDHDCVVVPGLGGFLCKYKSAEIKWNELTVVPPARMIAFNRALQQSDGLLIQSVAVQEHISYKKAEERVQDFVNHCLSQLQQQGSFMLPSIGRLYTDELKHIQFSPSLETLALDDSFGLGAVAAIPVKRLGEVETPDVIVKDIEHPYTETKRKAAWPYWLAASFAGLFLAGTLWINGIQTNVSSNILAGFNPASLLKSEIHHSSPSVPSTETATINAFKDVIPTGAFPIQANSTLNSAEANDANTYKIVVGAFRKQATCEKLRLEISQKGFNAEIHESQGSNFLRVVILQQGSTPEEALAVIKEQVNPSAWILK